MAVKGTRWQRTGRGYIVCALRRLKHALVPVKGSNAIQIFQMLPSRLQTRADMNFHQMPMKGLLKRDDPKLQASVSSKHHAAAAG